MFYSYAEKQGDNFFGTWQLRQIAFDSTRRYLYYSEPTKSDVPISSHPSTGVNNTAAASAAAPAAASASSSPSTTGRSACSPADLIWKKKMKVTAVVPVATKPSFVLRTANELDLYQLEVKGESRHLATGEYPPAGPLLCPAAGLSDMERARCNADNDAYIRDPFFLKEIFDALRDQFDELTKAKVRAAAADADGGVVDFGVQTLVSPRRHKGDGGAATASAATASAAAAAAVDAAVPVRVVLRCRDEREFRRFWYVLQSVLGYDKLIVRPYRGLPPYDPRNGVAFAHIPMAVWHTFQSLDKAVFYTFIRGNFYALEAGATPDVPSARNTPSSTRAARGAVPPVLRLKRVLDSAYLCITHDSVLCMRESGNIPRWLRLAEVQEFHWDAEAKDAQTGAPTPFCAFLSDAPIPDLFFEPTAPAHGAHAIASYNALVDIRRIARVVHDTCFASFSTRRVIRIKEVPDASMEAYVARTAREGTRPPGLQTGRDINSTLSCPLPKEQLAVVWQQVQSELLERGNMANRAAIPIYRSNAHAVELNEDQLSTVERELDGERERRDEVVGMPLERARQLERRRRGGTHSGGAARPRQRHRDVRNGNSHTNNSSSSLTSANTASPTTSRPSGSGGGAAPPGAAAAAATSAQVMPLTMELLQTPQLQGRFATTVTELDRDGQSSRRSGGSSTTISRKESTAAASEYSSYLVPGARYISAEEWQSGGYGSLAAAAAPTVNVSSGQPSSPVKAAPVASTSAPAASPLSPPPAAKASRGSRGGSAAVVEVGGSHLNSASASEGQRRSSDSRGGLSAGELSLPAALQQGYQEERTVNEIVGRSMAALDGSRTDLDQLDGS